MKRFTSLMKGALLVAAVLLPSFVLAQEETPTIKLGEKQVPIVGSETVKVQHPAATAYAGYTATFSKAGAAEALNVDDLSAVKAYILDLTTNEAVENNTDGWRSAQGAPLGWGSAEGQVCVKIQDPESGLIDYIGAIDETNQAGTSVKADWVFVSGDTAAYVVDVQLCFIADPTVIKVGETEIPVAGIVADTVKVYEKTQYSGDQGAFDLAKVLELLGAESLSSAQQYIVSPFDGTAVANETDGWRDPVGAPAFWGSSARMMCVKIQEPASGIIDYIGAIDDRYEAGQQYVAYWAFVANEKAALVRTNVEFIVDPASLVQVPETETDKTKVTVVKTADVSTERYATDGYETKSVSLSIADLASALGIEKKQDLAEVFADQIYVIGQDSIGCESKTLQPLTTTDGWLAEAILNIDGEAADPLGYCIASYYGGSCKYFIQKMAYDAESDEVSFVVGQYPGNLKTDEEWPVDLYVMWGDKAYVIKHTLKIVQPETIGFDGMEQVGETVELSYQQYPTTDYSAVSIMIDMDAMAQALECEAANISLKALADENGFSTATTANNGGWWLTQDGYVTNYGNNSVFYIEPNESGNYSALNMGQYPSALAAGESASTDLYLVYNNKYVKLHITLNVVEKEEEDTQEWEIVATRNMTVLSEANDGHVWSTQVASISSADLINTIGTASPTLYAYADETHEKYSDNYTMGEKPGFWLTTDGYPIAWADAVWGMTMQASTTGVSDGVGFKCMQKPGNGVVGNSYTGTFLLLNPENGKMIAVNLTNQVVDAIVESEVVGTDKVVVSVGGDDFEAAYDLSPIAEAIGFENLDAMNEAYCMYGVKANGTYSEATTPATWLYLDENAAVVGEEDAKIFVYFENGNINASTNDFAPEAGWQRSIEIRFEHPDTGKCFVLELTLMNAADYTAISSVKAAQNASALYDLSGRQVVKAQKGIYIKAGKKVVK